jgi:hypothetical protein
MSQPTFNERWATKVAFAVVPPPRFTALCPLAQAFADWCAARVAPVKATPTEVSVNQALLGLQEEWHSQLTAAPKAHRGSGSAQHTCLTAVYIDYVRELRELRSWQVNPPLVREPAPVVEPKYEITGSFIGITKPK